MRAGVGPPVALVGVLLAAWSPVAVAQEGGIELFAAETLFEEGTRVALTGIYKRNSDLYQGSSKVSDPLDRSVDEVRTVLSFDHGVFADLTLSALVPYVYRDVSSTAGSFDVDGLGDVAVLAKYRLYRKEWPQSGFNWAAIGGLETPTGVTDATANGMLVSPRLQPGLGAWNPFLATSVNYGVERFRFDGSAFYKLNTEGAQDYETGDFWSVEASAAYRFLHVKYPGPTVGARLGLQWRHERQAEQNGAAVPNTGYDQLLLRAGLTAHPTPNLDLVLAVDIPMYEDYRGTQLGRTILVALSFGIRF